MTLSDLYNGFPSNVPTTYDHWDEGECPDPPFATYRSTGENYERADGVNYYKTADIDFELYTSKKQPEIEKDVEDAFFAMDIIWEKEEVWIPAERLYRILYRFEIQLG